MTVHAAGMLIIVGLLPWVTFILMRYHRLYQNSTDTHKSLTTCIFAAVLPLFASGFSRIGFKSSAHSAHLVLGVLFLVFLSFQLFLGGFTHSRRLRPNFAARFAVPRLTHRVQGRVLLVLVLIQASVGVSLLRGTGKALAIAWLTLTWGSAAAYVGYRELRALMERRMDTAGARRDEVTPLSAKNVTSRSASALTERTMSVEAFESAVRSGLKLAIYNGLVIDMTKFLPMHPGGDAAVKPFIGKDITEVMKSGSEANANHMHSRSALKKTESLAIATLLDSPVRALVSDRDRLSRQMTIIAGRSSDSPAAAAPGAPASLPAMTYAEFQTACARDGENLVLLGGYVLDLGQYILSGQHPGGGKLLQRWIGKDITLAFEGMLARDNAIKSTRSSEKGKVEADALWQHSTSAAAQTVALRIAVCIDAASDRTVHVRAPPLAEAGDPDDAAEPASVRDDSNLASPSAAQQLRNRLSSSASASSGAASLPNHVPMVVHSITAREERPDGSKLLLLTLGTRSTTLSFPDLHPGHHLTLAVDEITSDLPAEAATVKFIKRYFTPVAYRATETGVQVDFLIRTVPFGRFSSRLEALLPAAAAAAGPMKRMESDSPVMIPRSRKSSAGRDSSSGASGRDTIYASLYSPTGVPLAVQLKGHSSAIFIAGGAGASAFLLYLKSRAGAISALPTITMALFEKADADDYIRNSLQAACREATPPLRFVRVPSTPPRPDYTGIHGRISKEVVLKILEQHVGSRPLVFIAGSPMFELVAREAVTSAGLSTPSVTGDLMS